ncbi:shikimate kinase [Candidatus Bandiella numerosa]|uniref:shikimate kinase n=1 Tax=Candidatus Bandiella numerosa TaxID=2570586 RepID=UPI00249EF043|nr:shikimate kinase [Candidatus Bandiella numerosa]WHA04346.1 shikimate kinase [Candidatus Bandiella numerosa]
MIKKTLTKPVVLIGMMGSGKSTVGKKLARKLNLQFYDSDKILEEREALSIVDIHDFMGERYFQQKEEEVIKEIIGYGVVVLSTGGSSFMNENIRNFIIDNTISIWLDSDLDTIHERVSRRNTRPELIASDNKKELLEKMMKEREPVFKQANIKIESDLEAHHLVCTIIEKLEAYQK